MEKSFVLDGEGYTCSRVFESPEVWRVELLMEQTFLPSVNAYVVRDGAHTLVVDTGTAEGANDTRLMRALIKLGVDPERMTLFCTHAHADHMGLARELAYAGARVAASEGTVRDMATYATRGYRQAIAARLESEGVAADEAAELADSIWSHVVSLREWGVACEAVHEGGHVSCGGWDFEVVGVGGHAPGHAALWLPERGLAFLGDSVLFGNSTAISFWGGVEDSLGDQLRTLRRLAGMRVGTALVGHGEQSGSLADRCQANEAHHLRRSARALAAVGERPGSCGADLVPFLGWRAPFDQWAQTPALTRWFLLSESIAHLDHLVATGKVRREEDADGVGRYFPA